MVVVNGIGKFSVMLIMSNIFYRDTTLKNRTSNECIGLQKRYRICNEQVSQSFDLI